MQKIATYIFIGASILFGILGIALVITLPGADTPDGSSDINMFIWRLIVADVFIILPSLALSIAGKYLKPRS